MKVQSQFIDFKYFNVKCLFLKGLNPCFRIFMNARTYLSIINDRILMVRKTDTYNLCKLLITFVNNFSIQRTKSI